MKARRVSRRARSLWQFSLAVYRQPQVPPACLMLQDRYGVDVNLLLYAGWRAWRGDALSSGGCASAMRRSEIWRQELVNPLRALRRQAGDLARADPCFGQAYAALKACELRLEQHQQAMLADGSAGDAANTNPLQGATIAAALAQFIAAIGIGVNAQISAALVIIAAAAEALPAARSNLKKRPAPNLHDT